MLIRSVTLFSTVSRTLLFYFLILMHSFIPFQFNNNSIRTENLELSADSISVDYHNMVRKAFSVAIKSHSVYFDQLARVWAK